MPKKSTTEEFIEKLKTKRVDKGEYFGYSKFVYKDSKTPGIIICPIHGEFKQRPNDHLHGQGCHKCGIISTAEKKSYTLKKIIDKFKLIHNDKFDYSKFVYTGIKNKGIIICPIHGEFEQRADNHLQGQGCKQCGWETSSAKQRSNTLEFIEKSKKINGDLFVYSNTKYLNNNTKVEIICRIHGSFWQLPNNHISHKRGCYECGKIIIANKNRSNNYEFMERSKKIHGNEYDYSLVDYKDARKNVKIICKTHGVFEQTPDNHLHGKGCPKCINIISKPETEFLDYLKIPNTKETRQVKILRKKVDGFIPETNTIIEFLGDYYHGNPKIFNPLEYNQKCHKTFGELYDNTIKKFDYLKQLGYSIKYIWESDYKQFKNGIDKELNLLTF